MSIEIDDTHQRVIEITFWMLDQLLCRFDQWANKHEIHSILYEEQNTLSDEQCYQIKEEIKAIRVLLKKIKNEFNLHQHIEPVSKLIHATSILFITDNLMSIKGKGMNAYGKTADEITDYLDPMLTKMIDHLNKITKISSEST